MTAWDYLLNKFFTNSADLLGVLTTDERYAGLIVSDIAEMMQNKRLTLREFLNTGKICLPRLAYQRLSHTAKLLFLGRCGNAARITLDDSGLWVEGVGLSPIETKRNSYREFSHTDILLRCDEWAGRLFEFDLVTDFWPVIPSRLFDRLKSEEHRAEIISASERAIAIHEMGNGISALGEQDPCLVHPQYGLYSEDMPLRTKAQESKVGRFEKASNNHWLFEINNHYSEEKKPRYILFVHISPRALTAEEECRLLEIEASDSEYAKGVRNGWSLLFLGRTHAHPIIRSGIVSREVMVGAIGEDIWQKLDGEEYFFLDDTNLRDLRVA